MFERVITQTIQRISAEVLRDRQSVPLTEILDDARIPTRFKPFFATETRWWLYCDVRARSANRRFDFAHPELSALLDYLEQVMFRHARFEHDEFVSTLDGAVKLTFNYLCRPQTTLKWYIFRGQPVKPLSEVMLRFESFLDYEYFGNVFAEWVERKVRERSTFEAISAIEFERIIRRIDDQILLSCTVDELLALLDPIFDFIGEDDEQHVPLDALIIFFDDKNITRLVDHLERYRAQNALVSRARFVEILEELLTSADENPEADFSSVYQNDELDDVVRRHLEAEGRYTPLHTANDGPERMTAELVGEVADILAGEVLDRAVDTDGDYSVDDEPLPVDIDDAATLDDVVASFDASGPDDDDVVNSSEQFALETTAGAGKLAGGDTRDLQLEPAASVDHSGSESPFAGAEETDHLDQLVHHRAGSAPSDDAASRGAASLGTASLGTASLGTASHGAESDSAASHGVASAHDEPQPASGGESELSTSTRENYIAKEAMARDLQTSSTTSPDRERVLDPLLERKVFKKIFNRDTHAFDETMTRLADADTWRHASQILDEIFIRLDIDPYSRTALRFTDSVYSRYVPKSHT